MIYMKHPLLGAAFKKKNHCFTFHGYTMETPPNPRITYLSKEVDYAEEWKEGWGSLDKAELLPLTNGFVPRNQLNGKSLLKQKTKG